MIKQNIFIQFLIFLIYPAHPVERAMHWLCFIGGTLIWALEDMDPTMMHTSTGLIIKILTIASAAISVVKKAIDLFSLIKQKLNKNQNKQ